MIELRQSTAGQEIPLGIMVDSADGDTEETALTIANTDIRIWKWGATSLASKNSGGATHIANGIYYLVLDATDTNTLGPMVIFVHVSGALYARIECAVLAANAWDSKYSTDRLQVDVVQAAGAAVSGVADFKADISGLSTSSALSAVASNVGTLLDRIIGTLATGTHNPQSGDAHADTQVLIERLTAARAAFLDAAISSRSAHSAGDVWVNPERTVTGGTIDTNEDMRGTDGAVTSLSGVATEANQGTINGNVLAALSALADAQSNITDILDFQTGNWSIVNNQMIFYRTGGEELARFNLLKDGVADSDAPDQRVAV